MQLLRYALIDGSLPKFEVIPDPVLTDPILDKLLRAQLQLFVFKVKIVGEDQNVHRTDHIHIVISLIKDQLHYIAQILVVGQRFDTATMA